MINVNFTLQTPVKSFQYYAYPVGLLYAQGLEKEANKMFSSVFLSNDLQFDTPYYSLWPIMTCSQFFVSPIDKLLDELHNHIPNGRAVHIFNIDVAVLDCINISDKKPFIHDILVIGYDSDKILAAGYTFPFNYCTFMINFRDLEHALLENTQAMSIGINRHQQNMSINQLRDDLINFCNSQKVRNTLDTQKTVGVQAYGIEAMNLYSKHIAANLRKDEANAIGLYFEMIQLHFFHLSYLYEERICSAELLEEYKNIVTTMKIVRIKTFKELLTPYKKIYKAAPAIMELQNKLECFWEKALKNFRYR